MSYSVARYLSIDEVSSPTFAVDGDVVCLVDSAGTPQVARLDEPGGWPERLTAHDERVSFVAASPDRPEVVFGMDQGSDERDQLFRYDLDDGTETAMTDRPDAIHNWGGWGPGGDRVAFTANRRESDTFDVYVQGRAETGDDAELVHEGPGGFLDVAAWAPDGDALVLATAHASFDDELSWLPLDGGDARTLTDDEPARYFDVAFGPDGDLLCLTNRDRETTFVGRVDVDTGGVTVVDDGGDDEWNVDHLAVDADSGRVAYTRNVDGYSDLVVGQLTGGGDELAIDDTWSPAIPEGVVSEIGFADGGDRLAVVRSADDLPHSLAVVDAESGGTTRWAVPGTGGIPRDRFRESETVRYETFDGRDIPAYWTLPAGADEDDPVPVIVDIHGGPEHQRRPWFYPTKQFFLNRGYAVLEPNVRGSSGYGKSYTHLDDREKRLDSVKDVRAAVEWLGEQPAVDEDRVVAYGRSYGGFMVLSAITQYPELWAAAVEFVGIADFETFLENTGEWRRSHREREYGEVGNTELLEHISPIHDVDRIECPLFIQHGANDPRVPVGEAQQIAAALADRGVPVETLIFDDEGHHTTDRDNLIEEFERIADFLDRHVSTGE